MTAQSLHSPLNVAPLYFVERDFGKIGRAFIECDRNTSSREQVIADILSGEIENVITVLEVFEDEGTCRNITEDIARECLQRAEPTLDDDGYPTFGHLTDFLESNIGVGTTMQVLAEAAE